MSLIRGPPPKALVLGTDGTKEEAELAASAKKSNHRFTTDEAGLVMILRFLCAQFLYACSVAPRLFFAYLNVDKASIKQRLSQRIS
jgi:hypothetical protein